MKVLSPIIFSICGHVAHKIELNWWHIKKTFKLACKTKQKFKKKTCFFKFQNFKKIIVVCQKNWYFRKVYIISKVCQILLMFGALKNFFKFWVQNKILNFFQIGLRTRMFFLRSSKFSLSSCWIFKSETSCKDKLPLLWDVLWY